MPSILNLKFKGNKSFVAFSNLNDTESLTKTWKVCTKVASYLEQGQRLENLSWRLWHLQNLMVDTDNAKSKREFKKLSKCMGDKLDKEKGRSIEELEAPDYRRNPSTEMIRQRAVEKERSREASQNARPGTIKRMQFTFSVDQPSPAGIYPVKKPDLKPSPEFIKRPRAAARPTHDDHADDMVVADDEANDKDPPSRARKSAHASKSSAVASTSTATDSSLSLKFPSLFSSDFGPSALLYPTSTLTTRMTYGEGLNSSVHDEPFNVARPTIELPLDELLDAADSPDTWSNSVPPSVADHRHHADDALLYPDTPLPSQQDVTMHSINDHQNAEQAPAASPLLSSLSTTNIHGPFLAGRRSSDEESSNDSDDDSDDMAASRRLTINTTFGLSPAVPPVSQAVKEVLPQTVAPSKVNSLYGTRSNTPTGRPALTVRTQTTPNTRSSGPGATATSLNPAVLRGTSGSGGSNSAPGGVKAECSNCGATHTPLWRRGLNDELNCNACGLYCKLHKRPRPKSMRNTHGEGRTQAAPRQETVDVMGKSQFQSLSPTRVRSVGSYLVSTAQCYNCHTTATPLWRKDDEGKTVCNACGLYYKLHGSARPISMKSDVIRKRSRHDARRMGNGAPDTPSASPGVSRRASPTREASPTLAPDSTTQMTYEYTEEPDYRSTQSELLGALGQEHAPSSNYQASYQGNAFPGPYHPDYLAQLTASTSSSAGDSLPFSTEVQEIDLSMSPRTSKRRRMSTDSASEPPSSAVSYSSYNDGYSSASSATSISQRSTEFPFSSYNSGPALRGSGNTFWHPPMLPPGDHSPHLFHPPMLPPTEESPMDYLHPPMLPPDDDALFSAFLHPPMALPADQGSEHNNNNSVHAPMFTNEFANHDSFDTSMRVY
ncbi:hypothetical protein BDN72DRAFT_897854 [Pluteus cervinus]|uniref:Uncharacterized protein n=1 Tax=Pluteus cervinus TaxID=181527 RepID=A0ACD3AS63_9AGAR|nr:hypothetical protein BDN72DRAFT_897854 [Pluteus cervinus]